MAVSKVLIGIVAGGVPVVAVTTAASLGAFTSAPPSEQTSQSRTDDSGSKSDLPDYVPLSDCYEVSTERTTGIKLIFCTDSKFYLYGADKSVTSITNLEVKSSTEILVKETKNSQKIEQIFPVSEEGWGYVLQKQNLNGDRFCNLGQQGQTSGSSLICQNNEKYPIKLSKLQQ